MFNVKREVSVRFYLMVGFALALQAFGAMPAQAAAPTVSSVSPLTATLNQKTTFTVYGSNLTNDLKFWMDQCANPVSVYTSGTTSKKFECTPSYSTGSKRVDVKDRYSNLLKTTYVTVVAPTPAPTVSSVSPLTATLNQKATFTVYGSNLTDDLKFWMHDCVNVVSVYTSGTTSKRFECTPSYSAGSKQVDVKDKNSNLLKTTYVTVAAPATTVSSVSPLTATLNQKTTFTVYGSNLTDDLKFWMHDCANVVAVYTSGTTSKRFECTPSYSAGSKQVDVKDANSNLLKTTYVTVVAPAPTVSSVSPLTATLNQKTTFTVYGSNLTDDLKFWMDECANPVPVYYSGTTSKKFECTPSYSTGSKRVDVKDTNSNLLKTTYVTVIAPAPTVSSVSPLTATLNQKTTFTVYGANLTNDLLFWIDQCVGVTSIISTGTTSKQFECTPSYDTGSKRVDVKDKNSNLLKTTYVTVVAPAPTVSSVSPLTATLDQKTTFTVSGANLTDDLLFWIGECADVTRITSTSTTTKQFECTPRFTAGNKEIHVKDKDGNFLKTATLTVADLSPVITSVTPSTVTLGERTNFTISGSNLTPAITFWLDECKDPTAISGDSTTKQVQCTPFFKTGQHSGKVVDGTAQMLLDVNFSSPVTDIVFDNAVLNSTMTITVTGQYLPADLLLEVDSCTGLMKKTGVSSMQQWTCTPTDIIGNHAGRLYLNPGGTVETFEVLVAPELMDETPTDGWNTDIDMPDNLIVCSDCGINVNFDSLFLGEPSGYVTGVIEDLYSADLIEFTIPETGYIEIDYKSLSAPLSSEFYFGVYKHEVGSKILIGAKKTSFDFNEHAVLEGMLHPGTYTFEIYPGKNGVITPISNTQYFAQFRYIPYEGFIQAKNSTALDPNLYINDSFTLERNELFYKLQFDTNGWFYAKTDGACMSMFLLDETGYDENSNLFDIDEYDTWGVPSEIATDSTFPYSEYNLAPSLKKQYIKAGTYYLQIKARSGFLQRLKNPIDAILLQSQLDCKQGAFTLLTEFHPSGNGIDLHVDTMTSDATAIRSDRELLIGEIDRDSTYRSFIDFDKDWFQFEVKTASQLNMRGLSSLLIGATVYDNAGNVMGATMLGGDHSLPNNVREFLLPFKNQAMVLEPGKYYLKLESGTPPSAQDAAELLESLENLMNSVTNAMLIGNMVASPEQINYKKELLALKEVYAEVVNVLISNDAIAEGAYLVEFSLESVYPFYVDQNAWFTTHVDELYDLGVFTDQMFQDTNGYFAPTKQVTKSEMARWTYLTLSSGDELTAGCTGRFSDVTADNKDCKYIEHLAEEGIITGEQSTNYQTYNPGKLLNRAEAAAIVVRAFFPNQFSATACSSSTGLLSDINASEWYCQYVQKLINTDVPYLDANGHKINLAVIQGFPDGTFRPSSTLQRDQIAKMLHLLYLQASSQVADVSNLQIQGDDLPDVPSYDSNEIQLTYATDKETYLAGDQVRVSFSAESVAEQTYLQVIHEKGLTFLNNDAVLVAANGSFFYNFSLPSQPADAYVIYATLADDRGAMTSIQIPVTVVSGVSTDPGSGDTGSSPTADYNNPQMMTFVYEYQDGLDHLVMTMEGRGLSYRIVADVPGCPMLSSAGTDTRWVYVCAGQDAMDTNGTLTFNGPTGPMLMYNFAIKFPIAPPPEDDFGNTSPEATLLTVGQVVNGSIAIPGDVDVFTFVAPTYGQYRLNYESKSNASVRFQLFRQPIEETISGEPGLWLQNTSRVVDTFFQAGEPVYFRVSVNHLFSTPTTGDYSIKLSSLADDDYYDGYNIAYEMTLAETLSGVIEHANDTDYFKFVPAESGEYTITYENSPGLLESLYIEDPYVRDFHPAFNKGEDTGHYTITLQQGVAYYLSVRSADLVKFGPYTLAIRTAIPSDWPIATYTATTPDANGHTILTVSTEQSPIVIVEVDHDGDGMYEQLVGAAPGWPAVLPRVAISGNTKIRISSDASVEPSFTSGYIPLLADGLAHDVYTNEPDPIVIDDPLLPIPLITSVSPTTAWAGVKTTFYVTGDHLPETLEMTLDQCTGIARGLVSETEQTFECTPSSSTGERIGVIKDLSTGQVLLEFTVMINQKPSAPPIIPVVLSVTPDMATIDEKTTFIVTGTDLPTTLSFWIADCSDMTALGGTTTSKSFECTPSGTTGTKTGTVKDSPAGVVLSSFTVNVVPPAPTVTSIVPLWATLDHKTIFSVNGANLPSTLQLSIADCVNLTYLPNTRTDLQQFSCTPSYTAGEKSLELKDVNGNLLKSESVTVYSPAPRVDSISPLMATLDQKTTFTVNGAYLTDALTFWIADCSYMTALGGTTTLKSFECTPSGTTGVKPGMVKSMPTGVLLSSFTVNVVAPEPEPIPAEPVDPLTAAINSATRIELYQEYSGEIVTPGQQDYYVLSVTADTEKNTLHEFYADPLVSCIKVYDLTLTIFTADDVLDACEAFANPLLRNNEFIPQAGHEYLFITRFRDALATGTYTFGSEEMPVIVVDDPIITPLPDPEPEPEPEPETTPEPEPTQLLATYTVSLQPGNSRFEVVAEDGLTMLAEVDLNNDGVVDISFGASPGFFATTIPLTVYNPQIRVMNFPDSEPAFSSGFVPLLTDGIEHQLFQEELLLQFMDVVQPTPVMYTPPAQKLVVEEPEVSEPDLAEPIVDAPQTDEPVAEVPVLVIEEPMTTEPIPEEPIADEYPVNEPVTEEAAVEDQPVVEPPPAEVIADEPPTQENPPA